MCVPQIIKVGGKLMKLWQKQFCTVFWDTAYTWESWSPVVTTVQLVHN